MVVQALGLEISIELPLELTVNTKSALVHFHEIQRLAYFWSFIKFRQKIGAILTTKLWLIQSLKEDGIDVVAIMTPPGSHQVIAEYFIKKIFM